MTQPPGTPDPSSIPPYGQQNPPPPPGYGAPVRRRPGMVTAAAVLAFVSGGLGLILNLVSLSLVDGFLTVLVIISLLVSAGLIFGGVQALQGKSFVILLALAGLAILINLIVLIAFFQVTNVLGFAIPILIIVFLLNAQSKAWIKSRGGTTLG